MNAAWRDQKFPDLIKALEEWMERNPVNEFEGRDYKDHPKDPTNKSQKSFQVKQISSSQSQIPKCSFYEAKHKASECTSVKDLAYKRQIVSTKKLFSCLGRVDNNQLTASHLMGSTDGNDIDLESHTRNHKLL